MWSLLKRKSDAGGSSERFHPGQSWTYSTRQGEEPSRAIVRRIDKTPVITIIHVALTDVLIRGRSGEYCREVGHLPFSEAAFAKSVREVVDKNAAVPDGFESGYATWRESFEKGEGGLWEQPIAAVVDLLDGVAPEGLTIANPSKAAERVLQIANRMGFRGRVDDEIDLYDQVVRRFGDEPNASTQVAIALYNKTCVFEQLGRGEGITKLWKEIVERFRGATGEEIREVVAKTLINKAMWAKGESHFEDALQDTEAALELIQGSSRPGSSVVAATGLINKGLILSAMDRTKEAENAYQALIEDFGSYANETIQARVAEAWFRLGMILAESSRPDLAASAFEVLDRQFSNGTIPEIEEFVKEGLYHRAWSLNRAERFAEEEHVQIEYERRYGLPHRS